jgi:hypothetical protein
MALSRPFPRKAMAFVLIAAVLSLLPRTVVAADSPLSAAEVDRIIRQAAAEAQRCLL